VRRAAVCEAIKGHRSGVDLIKMWTVWKTFGFLDEVLLSRARFQKNIPRLEPGCKRFGVRRLLAGWSAAHDVFQAHLGKLTSLYLLTHRVMASPS
jgi:hypothetical protein